MARLRHPNQNSTNQQTEHSTPSGQGYCKPQAQTNTSIASVSGNRRLIHLNFGPNVTIILPVVLYAVNHGHLHSGRNAAKGI